MVRQKKVCIIGAGVSGLAAAKAFAARGHEITIVDAWGAAGIATRFATIPDANHFTAIAPLADPNSTMTLRLKQLAGR